ncbi:MAG: FAD-dependent oxidoreductase [Janthinobacterium lividum]
MARVTSNDLPVEETKVLVVGAGPTGLMAGLVLARRGTAAIVIVIDRKATPTRESRALAVQARTMEIYDQLGLVEQVLAEAYPATRMQYGDRSGPLGFSFEPVQCTSTRYPGIHVFEQSRNEELLSSALARTREGTNGDTGDNGEARTTSDLIRRGGLRPDRS